MDTTYNPTAIEQSWYDYWERENHFVPDGNGSPYCIMIPPPNVTGTLHMGHAFQDTVMDTLIRYHRMKGDNTLWQPGTDHAGIATQMLVERQLATKQQSRHDLGREAFIDKVWEWKEESGGHITRQLRRMGASPDWNRERFTMDEGLSHAVREVFVSLYDEGLIYRGKRLVNWDTVLHTALSDLEVLSEEENGHLWHLRYPLSDGSGHLIVATTRPETMLGDSAVAVHPDDERYKDLIGKMITLPLVGREIPVIADDYVDPEFGSGCVKITPAHDFNDYAMGQRHDLEIFNIFTDSAAINDNAPTQYQGLDRYVARARIVDDLTAQDLIERIDDHKLMVPRGDRSNSVVEPYLTDQWYVDLTRETLDDGRPGGKTAITIPSIEAVRSGNIKFVPGNWSKTYYQWLENIEDWCISRQIWWGHRIPAWYDDDGNIYVAQTEAAVRSKYGLSDDYPLRQDNDVLDTWFSSGLWPFSTLGWPEKTDALATWYPTSVLVTGFDIIFFWVARMIMFGVKFMDGQVPFREVYIHGLVRDANGQKMSKSKGNVLDPLDIIDGIDLESLVEKRTGNMMQEHLAAKIEKQTRKEFADGIDGYGTDAVRFTFAVLASTGRDIRFDLKRVEGYRNFCNKLWNATRYVLMNVDDLPSGGEAELNLADRWIISQLQKLEQDVTDHLDHYRLDLAAQDIYEFAWNEYCDWYLELSKPVLNGNAGSAQQLGARQTLVQVLEVLLRLSHPIMPYITEELWQKVAPKAGKTGDTIMRQPWPVAQPEKIDEKATTEIDWVKTFILGIRRIRAEMDIKPGKLLPVLCENASAENIERINSHTLLLSALARTSEIRVLNKDEKAPESATALVGDMRLLIPLAGLIDKEAELARLIRESDKLVKEKSRLEGKLNNANFTAKAPAAVVNKEKEKLEEAITALTQLEQQRSRIEAL
ncbi:valine--tRNA ligase [Chromatiales bacterium (ex Bugula neritina AB1)]|nr:valine--tRNA ligase [Chromatiales bacterium (ex Bugula neritina AB1)]